MVGNVGEEEGLTDEGFIDCGKIGEMDGYVIGLLVGLEKVGVRVVGYRVGFNVVGRPVLGLELGLIVVGKRVLGRLVG